MKQTLFFFSLLILISLLGACDSEKDIKPPEADFSIEGLENRVIRKLAHYDNELFAATDQGLFGKNLANSDGWKSLGLSNMHLSTFVKISDNYWVAAAHDFNESTESFPLFVSTNKGESWSIVETNFGGSDSEKIADMDFDIPSQKLYAAGNLVIAESSDKGVTWTPKQGEWGTFGTGLSRLKFQTGQNTVWAGGQNAIEELVLMKINLGTGAEEQWSSLIPSPSVVKSFLFDPDNPQRIIIGGEGGIIETKNSGTSWSTLLERDDSKFFFGLAFGKDDTNVIIAAGWEKNFDDPQELILHLSTDGGQQWSTQKFGDNNLFGGVWDMVSVIENDKQVLYLALYKGGIARIQLNELVSTAAGVE
jgi:hypothetical protein